MVPCLIEIWRFIWSLVSRPAVESIANSETEESPRPSQITPPNDGEGSEGPLDLPGPSSSLKFNKLNDHVYELYKPKGQPQIEILFFHGLQFGDSDDAYWSTWRTSDDSQEVWPATWLANAFPSAHIFSISYDASVRTTSEHGRLDLFLVTENLLQALSSANIGQGFRRPVILVGHSFGGLVMKQLCVKAYRAHSLDPDTEGNQKTGRFLRNVGGLFFYGTPHRGIPLPKIGDLFLNGRLLSYVKLLGEEGARLGEEFDKVCKKYKTWRIASVGESQETSWGPFSFLVVPEGSARYGADFCTVAADHISVCKPAEKTSNIFLRLVNFIPQVHVEAPFQDIQCLPKVPVGLDLRVEVVQKMLQERTRVGIFGMGGVGKTTLARALFNKLGPTFEYTCFCPDVKLMEAHSISDLKERIWDHMHYDGKKIADKQAKWLELRGKRVLFVLDDVDHERHVELLSDIAHVVGTKCIFLMTSREKDILKFELDDNELYEVPFLNENDARPLFLSHAFPKQAQPPPTLEKHVDDVVRKCEGLPLTLEVLGKSLRREQDIKVWEQALEALGKAESILRLDERLWEKLMVSYNRLEEEVKQMFLDATTFFSDRRSNNLPKRMFWYEWTLAEAKATWSVVYGYESLRWKALVDASLVYDVREGEPIKVHEQLLSLGRKIAFEEAKKGVQGRRIWEGSEGWKTLQLTNESDHQEIHSLRLSKLQLEPFNIPSTSLSRLKNLQYLDVDGYESNDEVYLDMDEYKSDGEEHLDVDDEAFKTVSIDGAEEIERLQTNLVILRSPNLHFCHIHFDLALPHLVVLKLTSFNQLSLPNSFGHFPKLKVLEITDAPLLQTLPQSFGELSSLNYLEISRCQNLHSLPESFGGLSALYHLRLSRANFNTLPQSFRELSSLNYLDIAMCNLHSFPDSFGELSTLNHLEIKYCGYFQTLPESFGGLSALKHLEIMSCPSFHSLPESFGGLYALNHLEIKDSHNFQALPESFGGLSSLNHLVITNCDNFHSVPESFGGLSSLNHLIIANCDNLKSLPESFGGLFALNHLEIRTCHNLYTLPMSFGGLFALNHLEIYYCPNLHSLPESFGGLFALNHLEIRKCRNLCTLPTSFGGLSNLNHLKLLYVNLTTLPRSFGQLKRLNYLELSICWKLDTFPDSISELEALYHLTIRLLPLRSIPECIKKLLSLQILELGFLPYLKRLPPWLGEMLSAPPKHLQKFFRTQEGYFVIEDLKLEKSWEFESTDTEEWWTRNLHYNVMDKVRASNYKGALEDWSTIHIEFVETTYWRPFILQERGILKRLTGNLVGALEDLTAALEIYVECGKDDYGCRKHRGYVKYLLGDISGARMDAERALVLMSEREQLETLRSHEESISSKNASPEPNIVAIVSPGSENEDFQFEIEFKYVEEHRLELPRGLGVDPINFLDFKLE